MWSTHVDCLSARPPIVTSLASPYGAYGSERLMSKSIDSCAGLCRNSPAVRRRTSTRSSGRSSTTSWAKRSSAASGSRARGTVFNGLAITYTCPSDVRLSCNATSWAERSEGESGCVASVLHRCSMLSVAWLHGCMVAWLHGCHSAALEHDGQSVCCLLRAATCSWKVSVACT